jgi:hypothetical protein
LLEDVSRIGCLTRRYRIGAARTARGSATGSKLAVWVGLASLVATSSSLAAEGGCIAEGRKYAEGAQVEAYRVTGRRTRTAVPVYVVCRGATWIWPGTGMPVARP